MQPSPSQMHSTGLSGAIVHDRANDFTVHSWDLATGGLKALTAKRELPPRLDRRPSGNLQKIAPAPRSYTFALLLIAGILVMLIRGGAVRFFMIQPCCPACPFSEMFC